MTNRILKFIKEKDKLFKKLVKANIDDEIAYANLKAEFTNYKKILPYEMVTCYPSISNTTGMYCIVI